MATSINDLLETVGAAAGRRVSGAGSANAAIAAAAQLGRALESLVDNADLGGNWANRRQLAVVELARACRVAGTLWPVTDDRVVGLAAVASDHIAQAAPRIGEDDRWAVAVGVASAVRTLAASAIQFAPYTEAPALLRVQRLACVVDQLRALDPPDVQSQAHVDTLIPGAAEGGAIGLAATLLAAIDRAAAHGEFSLAASLTVAAAAESAAQQALTAVASMSGRPIETLASAHAAQSWLALQAALRRFDDGSRYAAPTATAVTEAALGLHAALKNLATGSGGEPIAGEVATTMRGVANQLPALADRVENAFAQSARNGTLFALARSLPLSEERAGDHIRNRAVMVAPPEIASTILAARAARRLSAALAVELDRTTTIVGRQPQPHLVRALAANLPSRRPLRANENVIRELPVAPDVPAR